MPLMMRNLNGERSIKCWFKNYILNTCSTFGFWIVPAYLRKKPSRIASIQSVLNWSCRMTSWSRCSDLVQLYKYWDFLAPDRAETKSIWKACHLAPWHSDDCLLEVWKRPSNAPNCLSRLMEIILHRFKPFSTSFVASKMVFLTPTPRSAKKVRW